MWSASQDLLITLLAPFIVYALGGVILYVCNKCTGKSSNSSPLESFLLSYLIGISIIIITTFAGGILGFFRQASLFLWSLGIASLIFEIRLLLKKQYYYRFINLLSRTKYILILVSGSLIIIYILILTTRAIIDSDVAESYIPMARKIVFSNTINYSTDYDYNVVLKGIGTPLIYGWIYSLSTSLASETFRLLPLAPIFASMIAVYLIAEQVTGSKKIASISLLVFSILPLHDRFLNYNAFYPDIFYLPFGLYIFYILLRHWFNSVFETEEKNFQIDMFYLGIAYGVATLLKSQTVFLLVPLFIWMAIKLMNKILAWTILSLSMAIPILMDIVSSSLIAGSIRIQINTIGFVYFLGLEVIWIALSSWIIRKNKIYSRNKFPLRTLLWFIIPFLSITTPYFLHQILLYGGFLWTSSTRIPNLDWAIKQLVSATSITKPIETPVDGLIYYILLIMLIPAGFQYLVIILVGTIFARKLKKYHILLLLSLAYFFAIVCRGLYVIDETAVFTLNPRDSYMLAPILSITLALVINRLTSVSKDLNAIDLLLVAYFGLIGYLTSPFLYEWRNYSHFTRVFISLLLGISKMKVEWANLILPGNRFVFLSNNILLFLSQSIICATPLLFVFIAKRRKYPCLILVIRKAKQPTSSVVIKTQPQYIFIIIILIMVIFYPRTEIMVNVQHDGSLKEIGIRKYFGSLSGFIYDYKKYNVKGILTFGMPDCLPYYVKGIRILDLKNAANLARVKDILQNSNISETLHELRRMGISHLLLPLSDSGMPALVSSFFSRIVINANFVYNYGSWILFSLNETISNRMLIHINIVPSYYQQANISSFYLRSYSQVLSFEAQPLSSANYLTFKLEDLPKLSLTQFNTVLTRAFGSENLEFTLRIFFTDGSSYDFPYRAKPNYLGIVFTDIPSTLANKTLRGDAFLSVKSLDGQKIIFSFYGIQIIGGKLEFLLEILSLSNQSNSYVFDATQLDWNVNYVGENTSLLYHVSKDGLLVNISSAHEVAASATLRGFGFPQLNLSDYTYIIVVARGNPGTIFTLRFYFTDGSSYDFPYKISLIKDPVLFAFSLSSFANKILRGDVYVGVLYPTGGNSWVKIDNIVFIRV